MKTYEVLRYSSTILYLGTQWIGGWVGLWALWKREKYLLALGNRTPADELVARRYTD
jgi:hypothetical protein